MRKWWLVTFRFVKLSKLGWMALFVVKRTTMKVYKGGYIFSLFTTLTSSQFQEKIIQIVAYKCKLNFTQSFFWKIIRRAFQDNWILAQISVLWILVFKIFWVWDAIVSPLLYRNSVKFSKMAKIILKICSMKKKYKLLDTTQFRALSLHSIMLWQWYQL